jgi:hypothetical protein
MTRAMLLHNTLISAERVLRESPGPRLAEIS